MKKNQKNKLFIVPLLAIATVLGTPSAFAQLNRDNSNSEVNPNYRLSIRDRISISVFDEPNLAMAQGIDGKGDIKVPLIGIFRVEGMTIRDVEAKIEQEYIAQKFLRNPIVTLDILNYSPKEVSVFGPGIARAGQLPFPPEIERIDLVELISMAGGFGPLANKKKVRVTRASANGSNEIVEVNVEEMIEGRKKNRSTKTIYIYPGDLIFVDEVFL